MTRHLVDAHPHAGSRPGILVRDVDTSHGIYSAGLPVLIIAADARSVAVCLDNGGHARPGVCHLAAVPPRAVREAGGDE